MGMHNKKDRRRFINDGGRAALAFMLAAVALTAVLFAGIAGTWAFLNATSTSLQSTFSPATRYTLTYDGNAEGDPVDNLPAAQVNYGAGSFDISDAIPERSDHTFEGWNTKTDGTGSSVAPGSFFGTATQDTTLYARWNRDERGRSMYTLIYDANDGTGAPTQQIAEIVEDQHTFDIADAPDIAGANAHKVFMGWADSSDATVPVYGYQGKDYQGNATLSSTVVVDRENRVKTIYAVWGINDQTDAETSAHQYAVRREEKRHSYDLYFHKNTPFDDDIDIYLWNENDGRWEAVGKESYNDVLNCDGETIPEVNGVLYTSGTVPTSDPDTKTGYTWGAEDFWSIRGLYATHSTVNDTHTHIYKFKGWAYTPDATEPDIHVNEDGYITDDIEFQHPGDGECPGGPHNLVVFAVWDTEPNTRKFVLNFNGNAANATGVPESMEGYAPFNEETNKWNDYVFNIPTTVPVNNDFVFVGWSKDKNAISGTYGRVDYPVQVNCETIEITTGTTLNSRTATLYAVWWYDYEFAYDANGGQSGTVWEHRYTNAGSYLFTPDATIIPTRDGYTFLGWSRDPNAIAPESYFNVTGDGSGRTSTTIYAVWQQDDTGDQPNRQAVPGDTEASDTQDDAGGQERNANDDAGATAPQSDAGAQQQNTNDDTNDKTSEANAQADAPANDAAMKESKPPAAQEEAAQPPEPETSEASAAPPPAPAKADVAPPPPPAPPAESPAAAQDEVAADDGQEGDEAL